MDFFKQFGVKGREYKKIKAIIAYGKEQIQKFILQKADANSVDLNNAVMKRKNLLNRFFILYLFFLLFINLGAEDIKMYPHRYREMPDLPSPSILANGTEVMVMETGAGEFTIVPVTQEKGEIYSCLYDFNGKGDQLWINGPDFPSLGKTGLHSEAELDKKEMITGRPIEVINFIARPGRFSGDGFIGKDEDIISVIKGDNRIVKKLGLKHAQMAKPLFHVWNAVLGNYVSQPEQKPGIFYYHGHKVFINSIWLNGYQESIFHDEIEGRNNIHIWRDLTKEEWVYLKKNYAGLTENKFMELGEKLSHLHISEMLPFYIMRYGFYEGHTSYRADPLAVAIIFGLKTIEEVDTLAGRDLIGILNRHFTKE